MFKFVNLVVKLNADLEQLVAEQVIVVVRLHHLRVSLLGLWGDRQSRANILFLLFCFFSHMQCVLERGLGVFFLIKLSSLLLLFHVKCLRFNNTR